MVNPAVWRKRKNLEKKRASDRVERFVELLKDSNAGLKQTYSDIARKICMKWRVGQPSELRRSYCKHCKTVFGDGSRVRLRNGKLVRFCSECKRFSRFIYKK